MFGLPGFMAEVPVQMLLHICAVSTWSCAPAAAASDHRRMEQMWPFPSAWMWICRAGMSLPVPVKGLDSTPVPAQAVEGRQGALGRENVLQLLGACKSQPPAFGAGIDCSWEVKSQHGFQQGRFSLEAAWLWTNELIQNWNSRCCTSLSFERCLPFTDPSALLTYGLKAGRNFGSQVSPFPCTSLGFAHVLFQSLASKKAPQSKFVIPVTERLGSLNEAQNCMECSSQHIFGFPS